MFECLTKVGAVGRHSDALAANGARHGHPAA
jgi:hypothetical protein